MGHATMQAEEGGTGVMGNAVDVSSFIPKKETVTKRTTWRRSSQSEEPDSVFSLRTCRSLVQLLGKSPCSTMSPWKRVTVGPAKVRHAAPLATPLTALRRTTRCARLRNSHYAGGKYPARARLCPGAGPVKVTCWWRGRGQLRPTLARRSLFDQPGPVPDGLARAQRVTMAGPRQTPPRSVTTNAFRLPTAILALRILSL